MFVFAARYQVGISSHHIISGRGWVDPCSIAPRLGHPRIEAANYSGHLESQMSIWTRMCYHHRTISPASGLGRSGLSKRALPMEFDGIQYRGWIKVGSGAGQGRGPIRDSPSAQEGYLSWCGCVWLCVSRSISPPQARPRAGEHPPPRVSSHINNPLLAVGVLYI